MLEYVIRAIEAPQIAEVGASARTGAVRLTQPFGGAMRIVASVADLAVMSRILTHIARRAARPSTTE